MTSEIRGGRFLAAVIAIQLSVAGVGVVRGGDNGSDAAAFDDGVPTTTTVADRSGAADPAVPGASGPSPGTTPRAAAQPSTTAADTTTTTAGRAGGDGTEKAQPYGRSTSGFPLEVAATPPDCVERGQRVTVRATTRPYSAIAAAVAYSEVTASAPYTTGAADPSGGWTWTFVVGPDATYGTAQIMVSAQDRSADSNSEGAKSTGEGAAKKYPIEVSREC